MLGFRRQDSVLILLPMVLYLVAGPVKICKSLEKLLGPVRQALTKVVCHLVIYTAAKRLLIGGAVTGQVVHADVKAGACGQGKQPLHCLRLDFHLFKSSLLFRCAAIRTIPVAVIV